MKLGAFSLSLSVKDLAKSKAFYEKLGFKEFGGNEEHNFLIMKNETTLIGLFQGMFEGTLLTFNPGWDSDANTIEEFDDVRKIEVQLNSAGLETEQSTTADSDVGPASFVVIYPDGNPILIDQHI